MASDVIDFVLQMLVERDILQGIPSWELLKDYLAGECMMAPERLEARRGEIVEKFVRCKREQLEKATHDLLGMTSNITTPASADRASMGQVIPEPAGLKERPNESKDVGSEGGEELSEPTIKKLLVSSCLNSTLERRNTHSFPLRPMTPNPKASYPRAHTLCQYVYLMANGGEPLSSIGRRRRVASVVK
jgi:hypothetical protein